MLPFFNEEAILQPKHLIKSNDDVPMTMIVTWQRRFIEILDKKYGLKKVSTFKCGLPTPVYEFKVKKERLGIVLLPIGAPVAAGFLEEYIVRDVIRFVCIGYAGTISPLVKTNLVVPTSAYRDEGTSQHYAPQERQWIDVQSAKALDSILTELGVPHICGKVWTTDAFYRETPSAVKMMKEQGCLCVDMECSAVMAVTQFRKVQCFQMMFAADSLEKELWDVGKMKSYGSSAYEKFSEIAIRVALS